MMEHHLDELLGDTSEATRERIADAVQEFVHHHNYDCPHEG